MSVMHTFPEDWWCWECCNDAQDWYDCPCCEQYDHSYDAKHPPPCTGLP